jgi:hypothetical protein
MVTPLFPHPFSPSLLSFNVLCIQICNTYGDMDDEHAVFTYGYLPPLKNGAQVPLLAMDVPQGGKPSEWEEPFSTRDMWRRAALLLREYLRQISHPRARILPFSLTRVCLCVRVCVAENVDEVHRELTRLKATLAELETFQDPFKLKQGEGGR